MSVNPKSTRLVAGAFVVNTTVAADVPMLMTRKPVIVGATTVTVVRAVIDPDELVAVIV